MNAEQIIHIALISNAEIKIDHETKAYVGFSIKLDNETRPHIIRSHKRQPVTAELIGKAA